mmetsp:Transcript_30133/g.86259  ORF Transcript_30133/g.86259 Transcript_30133/m.86259 type:complete len:208 (+) Transcript_30133:1113-1736(+)
MARQCWAAARPRRWRPRGGPWRTSAQRPRSLLPNRATGGPPGGPCSTRPSTIRESPSLPSRGSPATATRPFGSPLPVRGRSTRPPRRRPRAGGPSRRWPSRRSRCWRPCLQAWGPCRRPSPSRGPRSAPHRPPAVGRPRRRPARLGRQRRRRRPGPCARPRRPGQRSWPHRPGAPGGIPKTARAPPQRTRRLQGRPHRCGGTRRTVR